MTDLKTAQLPQGPIRYRERGSGEPIVFVHGFLVDSRLWEGTAEALAGEFRCIQPDWPLGSHRTAMNPGADLSPPGMARLISGFLEELDLENVTLVGNDSGGAMCQVTATSHPERIGRLVLTNCDTHENFPPGIFKALPAIARLPGAVRAIGMPLRFSAVRRIAFAPFAKKRIPDDLLAAWTEPGLRDADIRRDTRKVTVGMNKRHTLKAAERLRDFERPALLAWATEDRIFPLRYAERLAGDIPDARLERIADARTFVALDQPERLAEVIGAFMRETAGARAAA
ncbi:MAG: alpha/beta fold hydrolase [Solirubrobacterales bacterium]